MVFIIKPPEKGLSVMENKNDHKINSVLYFSTTLTFIEHKRLACALVGPTRDCFVPNLQVELGTTDQANANRVEQSRMAVFTIISHGLIASVRLIVRLFNNRTSSIIDD